MKKKVKKLRLAKETVRELVSLAHVAGGLTNTGCSEETSASCEWTCGCQSNIYVCIRPQTREC